MSYGFLGGIVFTVGLGIIIKQVLGIKVEFESTVVKKENKEVETDIESEDEETETETESETDTGDEGDQESEGEVNDDVDDDADDDDTKDKSEKNVEKTEVGENKETVEEDRKSTRLNSSHSDRSRMPSSA